MRCYVALHCQSVYPGLWRAGDLGAERVGVQRSLGFSDIFGGPDLDMLRKHMAPARKRAGSFTGSSLENVERVVEVKLKCTLVRPRLCSQSTPARPWAEKPLHAPLRCELRKYTPGAEWTRL
jgi:hypothetical protein